MGKGPMMDRITNADAAKLRPYTSDVLAGDAKSERNRPQSSG